MVNDALIRWLCHDLATPVATILTASELLGPDEDQEIRDMIGDAAKRLAARLRLIRTALVPATAAVSGQALARLIGEGTGSDAHWAGNGEPIDAATAAAFAGTVLAIAGTQITVAERALSIAGRPVSPELAAALAGFGDGDSNHSVLALAVATRAAEAGLHIHAAPAETGTSVTVSART